MNYLDKYNKYLYKYKIIGGSSRKDSKCPRTYYCNIIRTKLDTLNELYNLLPNSNQDFFRNKINESCKNLELLELSPTQESEQNNKYNKLLNIVEKITNLIKKLGVNLPEQTCKIKK